MRARKLDIIVPAQSAVAVPANNAYVRYGVPNLKIGTLSVPIFSFVYLVSVVVTNSLGIPPRRTSSTRVLTIASIRRVAVK